MSAKPVAAALFLLAILVGGVAISRNSDPSEYQIPTDLWFSSPFFRCGTALGDDLANYLAWAVPEKRVVVGLQERDPVTGEWHSEQYVYSTSYYVLDVAFRLGGQELYISGVQIDGASHVDVVEKWVFPTSTGGYAVSMAGAPAVIGVPRGPFAASVSIAGGSYIPPSGRVSTRQPVPEKSRVYSVASGGHFDAIVADPEGRFLLLHNYTTANVLSLDLSVSHPAPQVVFSASENPALSAARTMVMHDVPGIGRICRLTAEGRTGGYPSGTNATTILLDAENDGVFETFSVHSSVDIARGQTVYGESIHWQSVINFGWDWEAEFK